MKIRMLPILLFVLHIANIAGQDTMKYTSPNDTTQPFIHIIGGYRACNFQMMNPGQNRRYNKNPIHTLELGMSLEKEEFQISTDITVSEKQQIRLNEYENLTFQQNKIGISGGFIIHSLNKKIQYSSNLGGAYSVLNMSYQNTTVSSPPTVPWITDLQAQSSYYKPYVLKNKSTMIFFEQKLKCIIRKKIILAGNISIMQSIGKNLWRDKEGNTDESIPSMNSLVWSYGLTAGFRLPISKTTIP